MKSTPEIILKVLTLAGIAFANWAIAILPRETQNEAILSALTALVINLGTVLFWALVSMLAKMGANFELISAVVLAAEEQFGPGTSRGDEKLNYALAMIERELSKTKIGFFANMGFRLFSRPLISVLAPKIKRLWYTKPEEPPNR